MRTIARNARKKIAAIQAEYTACQRYDSSTGHMVDCPPTAAWTALAKYPSARLVEAADRSKYTVQVHSGLWYDLCRP